MSLRSLYNQNKGTFAPPPSYSTRNYLTKVAQMNSKGTAGNDLVQRNAVDFTFRPPAAISSYLQTLFQRGQNNNL